MVAEEGTPESIEVDTADDSLEELVDPDRWVKQEVKSEARPGDQTQEVNQEQKQRHGQDQAMVRHRMSIRNRGKSRFVEQARVRASREARTIRGKPRQ